MHKTEKYVDINDWEVVSSRYGLFAPPNSSNMHLIGFISGHPVKEDGKQVITSLITNSDGKFVRTRSGTLYRLNNPSKYYVKFLDEQGIVLNEKKPITLEGN